MPIHLTNPDRRNFLWTSLGAGAGLLTFRFAAADESKNPAHTSDADHVALLSDTHIAADARMSHRGFTMAANLLNVVADVLSQPQQPTMALIDGDCAFRDGQPGDYQTLASLVAGLPRANIPLHMAMGNHDNRLVFAEQLSGQLKDTEAVAGRHVSLIETKYANWFVLDTLQKVNQVTGEVGATQLQWLKAAIASRADKPAIVVGHHNLQLSVPDDRRVTGLQDSKEFLALLESLPHVKAYVYGHTHHWSTSRRDSGLNLINLPAIGYSFGEAAAVGWVDARLSPDGIRFTVHSLDPAHPHHMATNTVSW